MNLDQAVLLAGILTGIVIWAITSIVVFVIRKISLDQTLLETIKFHRSRLIECREYISQVCNEQLREGQKVEWYAYFTKETPHFFNNIQSELYRFYFAKNLIRIVKFYNERERVEALIEGFFADLKRRVEKGEPLSHEEHSLLNRKAQRIIELINLLVYGELYRIADLPKSYEAAPKAGGIPNPPTGDTAISATD